MKILGIVGSPRRTRGITYQVVSAILAEANRQGADTEILHLMDEDPQYCIHCGHPCFQDGACIQEEAATARSRRIDGADALVLGAPVYCWQPNGLTAALLDKYRMATGPWNRGMDNGRAAVGIAVAGGTGTGVFNALQSIYSWMCLWKFRALEPMPVVRFNLERTLARAPAVGRELARSRPRPYRSAADLMASYDALPYMGFCHVDELRWLAEQAEAALREKGFDEPALEEMRGLIESSRRATRRDDGSRQARLAMEAYETAHRLWAVCGEGRHT